MAKDWRRPTVAARRHWKQREAGQTSTAARGVKRLVFTLLSVVLVGVLIWYLIPRRQAVYFAYLGENYGPSLRNPAKVEVATLAPPVATSAGVYSREFAPLGTRIFPKQFHVADVASAGDSKLAAQKLVETLAAPLKDKWNLSQVEFLVLYVSAHGVAIDGEPYLMWNEDYRAELARRSDGQSSPNLMKLDDLLAQVKELEAKEKLLVLDCGQFVADPRLGLFVNEFPRLVEQHVAADGDRSLWVLTSHAEMQQAHVFAADRTSVFGHFVSRGVAGASRSRENDDLSLRAFVEYVVSEVGKTVASRTGGVQTPRLVNGELGALAPSEVPNITLLKHDFFNREFEMTAAPRDRPRARGVAAAQASGNWPTALAVMAMAQTPEAGGNPAAAGTPASPATRPVAAPPTVATPATTTPNEQPAGSATPAAPARPPTTAAPPAAATTAPPTASPSPPAQPSADSRGKKGPPATIDFAEVWDRVAKIEDPLEHSEAWSPVDYAPHLWAQLRRQLVWYAARYEIESDQRAENSTFIAAQILAPLDGVLLRDGANEAAPPSSIDLFGELQRAREAFRNGPAYASAADTSHAGVSNFRSAVRLKNYLTHRVAEQVRHYGYAPDPAPAITRYAALVAAIDELQRATVQLETESTASLRDYWTNDFGLLLELRDLRAKLRDIPDVQQTLHTLGGVPAEPPPHGVAPSQPPEITDRQPALWVDLYARLAALSSHDPSGASRDSLALIAAGSGSDTGVAEQFEQIRRIAGGRAPRSDEQVYWQAYRAVGQQVRRFSERLADGLRQPSGAAYDDAALFDLERRLRLVDGCDAPDISRDANVIPRRRLCPPIAHRVEIKLADAKVSLPPPSAGEAGLTRVVPKYVWRGPIPATATVTVSLKNPDAAANVLEVKSPPRDTPVSIQLAAEGNLPEIVLRQADSRKDATNIDTAALRITVDVTGGESSSRSSTAELNVEAHGSELVQLGAYRVRSGGDVAIDDPRDDETTREIAGLQLGGDVVARLFHSIVRPFPNRADQYRFRITNVSGASTTRNVTVDVLAAKQALDPDNAAALFDARGEPRAEAFVKLPQFTRPLTLSANAPAVYPFVEPAKPAADEAAKPAEAPPAAAPAEAKKEEAPPAPIADFRDGLVFHVRDNDKPDLHWYHWIEFRPREPSRYVEPRVTYDSRAGRLEILIRPLDGATPPPDGFSAKWSTEGVAIDPLLPRTMEVVKKRSDEIRLGVSNWRPPEPRPGEKLIPLFVTVDDYPRAFVYEFTPAVPPPDPQRPLEPLRATTNYRRVRIVDPPRDLFAYEKKEAAEVPIRVGVEADGQPSDIVTVSLNDGNSTPQDFRAKRAAHVLLFEKGWDKDGVFTLTSTIGDYVGADALHFDTTLAEELIPLSVELKSGERTVDSHRLRVAVDENPPTLSIGDPSPLVAPAEKGLQVTVTPTVFDRGGVEKVAFFIFPESKSLPSDEELAKPDFVWPPPPPPGETAPPPIVEQTEIQIKIPFDRGPGRWSIWAVAINQVGRRSIAVRTTNPLIIEEPEDKGPPAKGGAVTIAGVTLLYGDPLPGVSVKLVPLEEGKGEPQSTTSVDPMPLDPIAEAGYKFESVSPGKYKIVAAGKAKSGRTVVGEVPNIVIGEKDTGTKTFDVKLALP